MTYRISRRANGDIEKICDYIAEDNPEAAEQMDARFHAAIQQLAAFPGMGHTRAKRQALSFLDRWKVPHCLPR